MNRLLPLLLGSLAILLPVLSWASNEASVCLQSDALRAVVSTRGAELTSIQDAASGFEYLWQKSPTSWEWQAPLLFPIVGGLRGGQYVFDGETYRMPGHGFARRNDFAVTQVDGSTARFFLRDTEQTRAAYPFPFELEVIYTIDGRDLFVSTIVRNTGKRSMVFGFGYHPGFNMTLRNSKAESAVELKVQSAAPLIQLMKGESGALTAERRVWADGLKSVAITTEFPVGGGAVVLKTQAPISARLEDRATGRTVTLETDSPYFGIWRRTDADSMFLCLEPWWGTTDMEGSYDDLRAKPHMQFLEAGATMTAGMRLRFD